MLNKKRQTPVNQTLLRDKIQQSQNQLGFSTQKKSNMSNLIWMTFLLIFCLAQNANCRIPALSANGPLYSDSYTFINAGRDNAVPIQWVYDGWAFTANLNPIPEKYLMITIESIGLQVHSFYFTFNISDKIVQQTKVLLNMSFANPSFSQSVTIRMLAIDYDMLENGSPYTQLQSGIFFFTAEFMPGSNSKTFLTSISDLQTNFRFNIYLAGFRLKCPIVGAVVVNPDVSRSSGSFTVNVVYSSGCGSICYSRFAILFFSANILSSFNRFTIAYQSYQPISNSNSISYTAPTTPPSYLSGQTLIFGLRYMYVYNANLKILTTIYTTKSISSTINFGSLNVFKIHFFIIAKQLCPLSAPIYLSGIDQCDTLCPLQGYYSQNPITCNPCYTPRCLTCNDAVCLSCDSPTRALVSGDCTPNNGYYQNNQTIAGNCSSNCLLCLDQSTCYACQISYFYHNATGECRLCSESIANCQLCSDQTTCVTCQIGYFYDSGAGACQFCSDSFSNCLNCSIPTITNPVSCIECLDSYYINSNGECAACSNGCLECSNVSTCTNCSSGRFIDSNGGCTACVPNCTQCQNGTDCTTCIGSDYYYWSNTSSCRRCNNIFPGCIACSNGSSVACQTCPNAHFVNTDGGCTACVPNCTQCQDETDCTTCIGPDYYYWSNTSSCRRCSDLFPGCIACSNGSSVVCETCPNAHFVNADGGCTACVPNCTDCQDNQSCTTCLSSEYIYSNDTNNCILCQDLFQNCAQCSNSSSPVQCQTCESQFVLNISTSANKKTKCFFYCGDWLIQPNQECDDGNKQSLDGCSSNCKVQQGFNCTQTQSTDYPDYNTTSCFYAGQIVILKRYLEKDPSQNKVQLRFNFQPNLAVFASKKFNQRIESTISVLWDGYKPGTLKALKVQNGLYQNGLFKITFCYQKEWKKVQILVNLANSNLSMFTTNPSRLLQQLSQSQQNYSQRPSRILQSTIGQTPSSNIILPQHSDNNLVMYSDNYNMYSITLYMSYFLACLVWIYWILGLFYGKTVVIDFILVIQLILLCSMTTGQLSPGFSGLMLQKFVFFSYAGIFSSNYQTRPIYDNIGPQFKSANISSSPVQNLSMMLGIVMVILIIGLIAKLLQKKCQGNKFIQEKVVRYIFGQFLLYGLLPFLLNGNISTVLYLKGLASGSKSIQIMDVLALSVFYITVILTIVLFHKKPQFFGEFRSCFLRFDISQHFYMFVIIYITIIGFSFSIMFGQDFSKYAPVIPAGIFISIIIFNICKNPYWYATNQPRIYILYGLGLLLTSSILVHNMMQINFLRDYLPTIIISTQVILSLITGYYLFYSIKNEGMPKLSSFLKQYDQKNIQIQVQSQKSHYKDQKKQKYKLNKAVVNYYEKQSKLLQSINKNTLPETIDYQQQYQHLNNFIQNNLNLGNIQQVQEIGINDEQKKNAESLLKGSKYLKMSLRSHLLNQNGQNQCYYSSKSTVTKQKISPIKGSQQNSNTLNKTVKKQNNQSNNGNRINSLNANTTSNILLDPKQNLINENLQKIPQELIQDYKISEFKKKQKQVRSKRIQIEQLHDFQQFTQNFRNLNSQPPSPIQKVKQISYYQYTKQLEEEDKQLQRQKNKI